MQIPLSGDRVYYRIEIEDYSFASAPFEYGSVEVHDIMPMNVNSCQLETTYTSGSVSMSTGSALSGSLATLPGVPS